MTRLSALLIILLFCQPLLAAEYTIELKDIKKAPVKYKPVKNLKEFPVPIVRFQNLENDSVKKDILENFILPLIRSSKWAVTLIDIEFNNKSSDSFHIYWADGSYSDGILETDDDGKIRKDYYKKVLEDFCDSETEKCE